MRVPAVLRSDGAIAVAVGVTAAALSVGTQLLDPGAVDIDQLLFAAGALLRGQDPYSLMGPGRAFWSYPLYYPLTAALAVMPFAILPWVMARALFSGISLALLAFGILRTGRHRLPILLAWPVIRSAQLGQWGPLLCAGFLLPGFAWVWLAKPNFALPFLLARRPTRHTIVALLVGGLVLGGVTLAMLPAWPLEWLHAVRKPLWIRAPILSPFGGPLLALALLRWRDADARLLFGLAVVPQTVWPYNFVPALLVARTMEDAWQLTALTWVVLAVQSVLIMMIPLGRMQYEAAAGVTVALFYLPVLWLVLRRPAQPGRVERALARLRRPDKDEGAVTPRRPVEWGE